MRRLERYIYRRKTGQRKRDIWTKPRHLLEQVWFTFSIFGHYLRDSFPIVLIFIFIFEKKEKRNLPLLAAD